MRPVTVTSGRHPFEVVYLAAALAAGVALLVADVRPGSVRQAMPLLVQAIWEVGLILAGLIGLVGLWWQSHRLDDGLTVETIGVGVLGTVTTMYAVALYAVSGTQALAAGAFVGATAIGSWWRIVQIIRDLRRLAVAVADDGDTA